MSVILYSRAEYIETGTGNKISRKSAICGSKHIVLGGKTVIQAHAIIRGDLRRAGATQVLVIALGKYCRVSERVVIRPPCKTYRGILSYYPVKIGDHVHIGQNSVIEAATLGDCVQIGANCIVGKFAVIKDGAQILDGAVVPPHSVIPPLAIFSGVPARQIGELPEGATEQVEARTRLFFSRFQPVEDGSNKAT